jgi:tetratricopeptide (TPR) repeat protein
MERTKYKIIFFFLICFIAPLKGNYKTEIYSAYINNNIPLWKSVIDEMSRKNNKDPEFLAELLSYQYGYIAWCIGNKKNEEAKKYLGPAEKNTYLLPNTDHYQSVANAYRAAFYGYHIGLNILYATFYGFKSNDCAKAAMKLDKDNPIGYIQYANMQFYMPSVFGGSKTEAIKYYLMAEEIMEKNKEEISKNWNYINLLTIIAQSYALIKDYEKAKLYYEKILIIEPGFNWVKNELYPEMIKKMKK